ncbi:class I SAM-dependent methyltransferase [Streptacidiphilus sp. EB129]|uniref:class I SAM-dependent methyltransferase n=1 Tax=Streptacidiphilus sp. EB129 TaxID=3156262 RepID=UPI003512F47B
MDLTRQFAMPRGPLGRLVGRLMAVINKSQVEAVVAELAAVPGERVLEIGFGPGVGLVTLARTAPEVRIEGVDPSSAMVAQARRRVRRFGGRVRLREGTAAALPWEDDSFDAVFAANSAQLWQPRVGSLAEVLRVLRPGGRLVLGVLERAVLPDGGSAGPQFDEVLLPDVEAAGFAGVEGEWRPSNLGGRELLVRAVRPAGNDRDSG